jgi:hypothetical protein
MPQKVTVVCGADCFAFLYEFFVNNTLDVKESDVHANTTTVQTAAPVPKIMDTCS